MAQRKNPIDPNTGLPKIGRPSDYSPEKAIKCDAILERFSKGEAVRNLLNEYDITPGAFYGWIEQNHDGLTERYTRARTQNAFAKIDEAEAIADNAGDDFFSHVTPDGEVKLSFRSEHVKRSDLRVKFRMWYAEKVLSGALNGRKPADENATGVSSGVLAMLDELAAAKSALAKKAA